jgi:hypothetical protein
VSTLAHGAGAVRLPRAPWPTWGAAFAAAFLGWLVSAVAVGLVTVLTYAAGLHGASSGAVHGGGIRDWPHPQTGVGSTVTNAIVWLAILTLTALLIRGALADRTRKPISAFAIFAVLIVTGFAPFIPRGLLDLPWLFSFVLTAALLRLTAGTLTPLPKRATARLLLAGAPLLVVPVVYGAVHPLWFDQVVGQDVHPPPPRSSPAAFTFGVRNTGHADVELQSVAFASPGSDVRVVDVRVDRTPPGPSGTPFDDAPRPPYVVDGRATAFVQLRLQPVGCPQSSARRVPVRGEGVIRYRLGGRAHTAKLPLELPAPHCQ